MATCLQVVPMVWSVPSSSSSTPLNFQPFKKRSRTLRFNCYSILGGGRSSKIPMPPLNPNDPFLNSLATFAAKSPESLYECRGKSHEPPFLNLLGNPKLKRKGSRPMKKEFMIRTKPKSRPPNLPSILLDARVVYIGMPLVPIIAELVFAQLLYLQWKDPKEPIYMYINSTGVTRDDGAKVGSEPDAFFIHDAMMTMKNEIHTVVVGCAAGEACLLAAAGTKGKRYMMEHSKVVLQATRAAATGLMPASDVLIYVKEAEVNKDTLVKLISEHTGNSEETVAEKMKIRSYMDAEKAKAFGIIDNIIDNDSEEKILGKFTVRPAGGRSRKPFLPF